MNKKIEAPSLFALICALSALFYFFTPSDPYGKIAMQGTLLFLIPASIIIHFKTKPVDVGLSVKEWKKILLYSALLMLVAIPGMLYAAQLLEFQEYYPRFAAFTFGGFVFGELLILPIFLFQEFFYRGFALFQLRKYIGNWAIPLQAIPYAVVHWGKPMPEVYYSFFTALVFGYLCLKAKSFLPAFVPHYVTSVIFDYLCW